MNPIVITPCSTPLLSFRYNIYSQNGEDGIIEELFHRLCITGGHVVEFGAWDGHTWSNTFNFIAENPNWRAIYIEGDQQKFKNLLNVTQQYTNIIPIEAMIDTEKTKLDNVLASISPPIPKDFMLLSIDVDSNDYQIWQTFTNYFPIIVVIEINSNFIPPKKKIHSANDVETGSSFTSMVQLGLSKGYVPICHTGNMFFIRKDYFHWVGVSLPKNINDLFLETYHCNTRNISRNISRDIHHNRHITKHTKQHTKQHTKHIYINPHTPLSL